MRDLLITNGQTVSIGRASENDVVLDDPTVSRRHATLRAVRGHYYLSDGGSTNGTYLRGQRVYDAEVRAGDRIRFGDAELTLRTECQ
jgi:pSer/pThr/pTyr-binding forkhead associated (FHA) protein